MSSSRTTIMTSCEMCGKTTNLVKTLVENTELMLCNNCSRTGKLIQAAQSKKIIITKKETPEETLVPDFAQKIRAEREKRNLSQKDFAKILNQKESVIRNIEHGEYRPNINESKNMEKTLKIKLVEMEDGGKISTVPKKQNELTIGDIIKLK